MAPPSLFAAGVLFPYIKFVMKDKHGKKTVLVAMSGGVDSSVAAALLLEQGYHVIGVTMKTYDFDEVGGNITNETSCCGLGAMNDARLVAAKLGIPHYVVDFRNQFGRHVIDYFVNEYLAARTPNPCIMCNRDIKWGTLLEKADALGADYLATGHYARVRFDETKGRYVISEAVDKNKDQSYALWAVSQQALSRTLFPLGAMTKTEVRELAQQYGLRTANKEESYEICFVADNNYERFLKQQVPVLESTVAGGEVVWGERVVGRHRGYPFYTVGQRRGLGAFGKRVYVTGIDRETNRVFIGTDEELLRSTLVAQDVVEAFPGYLSEERSVSAKVRYKDEATPAQAVLLGTGELRVRFHQKKRALTPGQSVVLYEKGDVIAGGIIHKVLD
jgi:tRNA-specific 2-thiouridylase